MCPENQVLGGTSKSKASEGLSTSSWSRTAGHSLCAWLLAGAGKRHVSVCSLILVCTERMCVFASKLQAGLASKQAGKGLCWYLGELANVECQWDKWVSACLC